MGEILRGGCALSFVAVKAQYDYVDNNNVEFRKHKVNFGFASFV